MDDSKHSFFFLLLFFGIFVGLARLALLQYCRYQKLLLPLSAMPPRPSRCSVEREVKEEDREVLFINSQSPQSSVKHPVELPEVSSQLQSN